MYTYFCCINLFKMLDSINGIVERGQNGLKFEYFLFVLKYVDIFYHSTLSKVTLLNDFFERWLTVWINPRELIKLRLLHPSLQFWTELNTVFCDFLKLLIASRPPSIGTENFKHGIVVAGSIRLSRIDFLRSALNHGIWVAVVIVFFTVLRLY